MMIQKVEAVQLESIMTQLISLINDYIELCDMKKDTTLIETEIQSRIVVLKALTRDLIENSLDIAVMLDGELLIYEKSIKKKKYIERDKMSQEVISRLDIHNDGNEDYYFYLEKEVYRLDIEEENLMAAIRFVNYKKVYPIENISKAIKAIRKVVVTAYGYRLSYATVAQKQLDTEKIYTGTVFNNTSYSKRSHALLEKLMLKLVEDYIIRINSSYSTLDYVIHQVGERWLIINLCTGVTDVLNEQEIVIAHAAFDLKACFDENNILANDRKTDDVIEKLQAIVIDYLEKRKATTS